MVPAWQTASQNAKKNKNPYGITITTTPNNLDIPQGAFCKKIIDNSAEFIPQCFDMTEEEIREYLDANSRNNFMFVQYSYKDLGRDEAWLQKYIKDFQGDLGKMKREILLVWPRSMESSVFSEEQLEKIHYFVKEKPESTMIVDGKYPFNFYEKVDLNRNYILSCDVSGGLSGDNSAISIIDPETFKAIGYFKNNKIDTDSFKKLIFTMMTLYFRNAYLLIEANSYGLAILDSLMKDPLIEGRMYREDKGQLGEKTQKDGFTIKKKTKSIRYGVTTTKTTRKLMFDILFSIVDEEPEVIISPELYEDISVLERKKNSKIEAMEGKHDDCLMAYLIFRYAVFYGKCFRDRFGIAPVPTKSNLKVVSEESTTRQIERIILSNRDGVDQFRDSTIYQNLLEQQKKVNEGKRDFVEEKKKQSFINICKLNSD